MAKRIYRLQGVTAQIRASDGTVQTIEAKFLAGCDGPRSPVRHALGLAFEGSTFARTFYVADAQIDWDLGHDALHICLARDSFVLFFPMEGEKRYRIVGNLPDDAQKDETTILYEEIERKIKDETEIALEISDVRWFSTYKIHTRHVSKFSQGRCFLAGDAAHIHSPVGAQGMNTGIQDAYNLAWKLALVLKGQAAARILATYNQERLPNAKRLLQTTDRLFELAAGSNWLATFIRTTVLPPLAHFIFDSHTIQNAVFPVISQIGIHYRDGALSEHGGDEKLKVKAGDRMPYFLAEGKSIYDRLREPKFHFLRFGNGAAPLEIGDELVDFQVFELNSRVTEIFGTAEPFCLLLRPDNYVAAVFLEAAAAGLRGYFEGLASSPLNSLS